MKNLFSILPILLVLFSLIEGNSIEDEIDALRQQVMTEINGIKYALKRVSNDRLELTRNMQFACNSKQFYHKMKHNMRNLMGRFANISLTRNIKDQSRQNEVAEGKATTLNGGKLEVANYIDAAVQVRSLHSLLDDIETEMWKQRFNRQIAERKVHKLKKKMDSSKMQLILGRLATVGMDNNAGKI
ncbi:hypothetical protein SNE40_018562 [Patella caerulea]|uniref:Uncharacterized protein n=1 Tax=Patella caerulea TaxID=87958 RepID=A0AAN8P860_PATCE